MAKIGFEYIVAGALDTDNSVSAATAAYTNTREIGPGANVNGSPTSSDVKDYGDDRVVATDVSVTGGTLSLELNEPSLENEAWILGHSVDADGAILRNTNDIPPYVGIGFVGKSRKLDNTTAYRAKIYLKAQFKEPSDENATKQDSVSFSHTTMEGNLFQLENGDWKLDKVFETLAEAKAYVDEILCMSAAEAETE
ncbi:MAG: hypothetical protein LUI07_08405 [Lachnospiraceae bacterium]|nr:hypothetical protein [Lachnospiraceae bacterium]